MASHLKSTKQKPIKRKTLTKNRPRFSFYSRVLLKILLMGLIWSIIGVGLVILWFSHDLPDLKNIQINSRKPSVIVQSFDGVVLGTYGDLYEDVVKVEDLPIYVPQALMAVEDRRFYQHFGVDFVGLIRATWANYRAKRVVQGGSTLTQQLAKNILFSKGTFSINDRSYRRKVQEVLLAVWLELKFTKEQILTIYLNRVYFGAGTYGVDAAARRYFNKSARNLTVFEAAVIAGLLKAPSKYSPAQYPERATARAKIVLELMQNLGFIKDYQHYLKHGEQNLRNLATQKDRGMKYFADWIYEGLPDIVGPLAEDLIVITTLDVKKQRQAERVCQHYLKTLGVELKVSEAALLAMEPSGAIKVMVGGSNYSNSQFNRVTQALRQPGSAFKTIIYQAALESGMTPETLIDDSPFISSKWKPSNYKWKSRGMVTLEQGLAYSINSVSIRLVEKIGPRVIAEVARRLGVTCPLPTDLSIALGTGETTLLELTTAYATYANSGCAVWPYGVAEIRDKRGKIIYQRSKQQQQQIVSPVVLAGMRQMLRAVIERGSGRAVNINQYVGGKTGSNGSKDAWVVVYQTPTEQDSLELMINANEDNSPANQTQEVPNNLVVGVWVGNDNNKPMAKISTGGRLPARIAAAFLKGEMGEDQSNNRDKKLNAENRDSLLGTDNNASLADYLKSVN